MTKDILPWQPKKSALVPVALTSPEELVPYAKQLSRRDIVQLSHAFASHHYEMASTFIWTKAMAALKNQLETLGMEFIGEMLQRPDITAKSDIAATVTDSEALSLAEALGMVRATEAMRLRHAHDVVRHFAGLDTAHDADEPSMNPEEAVVCVRACIENILGHPRLDVATDFARFRRQLESKTFSHDDPEIHSLVGSPYFYRKTTLSVLLALLKTASGAQLQHAISNANLVILSLWDDLKKPERWQTGQTYAELYAAGRKEAWNGLKAALVRASGFDYVPETLRSDEFTRAAKDVLQAHEGMNNFYNEPAPMQVLASLGTSIPEPAFPVCMTATLSVWLGNFYGHSWNAQDSAARVLRSLSPERWTYYLDECLPADRQVLYKLTEGKPAARWLEAVEKFGLKPSLVRDRDVRALLKASNDKHRRELEGIARRLYTKQMQKAV